MGAVVQFAVSTQMEVHDCPTCGVQYASPVEFFARKNRESGSWYCPNGHSVHFSMSALEKSQRELAEEERRHQATLTRLNSEEQKRIEAQKSKARLEKRIKAGVCPCCHRTFSQLQRHLANKHPDYHMKVGKPKLP